MKEPINILIVDDEPKNLTVLEAVLDDPAYRLVLAESADKALISLVFEEFALLVLDIRMPGMNGFELAQVIKEREKTAHVPIIFLTAYYNEDQHIIAAYGTGAVDFLLKPVNPSILRSKVAVFAELHRRQRETAMANLTLTSEVTERRRAEEQLRDLNETLEQRVTDRTEALNASLHEKEVLLSEVHHRVKNNLQVVSSLLNLQGQRLTDPILADIFAGLRDRVWAMAAVHEQLYRSSNFAEIDLAVHLESLVGMLMRAHAVTVPPVLRLEPVTIDLGTAVPLSLIANELITNAIKHARVVQDGERKLTVDLRTDGANFELCVADNGPGFPPELDVARASTLGLQLVRALVHQIRGEMNVSSSSAGASIAVRWCPSTQRK